MVGVSTAQGAVLKDHSTTKAEGTVLAAARSEWPSHWALILTHHVTGPRITWRCDSSLVKWGVPACGLGP